MYLFDLKWISWIKSNLHSHKMEIGWKTAA